MQLNKKVLESFGDKDNKEIALETLDNVNHKLSIILDEVITSIERVERLFKTAEKIKVPEYIITNQKKIRQIFFISLLIMFMIFRILLITEKYILIF